MLNKLLLPVILIILGYGFWLSPDFKEIAAGVAIFLFGMMGLEAGFRIFTGGVLEKILKKTTDTKPKSLLFGIISTSIMQSSSLVSVIAISFLGAGLIGLAQGIGIIFGANLGTTTGAWLVAAVGMKVKISAYAMPLLVFGVILAMQKKLSLKGLGYVLAGIGFLFLGIHYMKEGFEAFKSHLELSDLAIDGLKGLLIYTLIGIVATVVMQSSHATLVLTITALDASQVTYSNALALAIGANVGTTITAILGAMGSNVDGKRLAAAHLIFNLLTGAIALFAIEPLKTSVDYLAQITGISEDDYTLKLAVFHTIFNLIGVLVMLPLIDRLVTWLEKLLPDPERRRSLELSQASIERRHTVQRARFLNQSATEFPDTSLNVIIKESNLLLNNVLSVLAYSLCLDQKILTNNTPVQELVASGKPDQFKHSIDDLYYYHIKGIHSDIVEFSARARLSMDQHQLKLLDDINDSCRSMIDALKDAKHFNKNLVNVIANDSHILYEDYQNLRFNLANLLRSIEAFKSQTGEESLLTIDGLRVDFAQLDMVNSGRLNLLITEKGLSGAWVTSLVNDNRYSQRIAKNLLASIELIAGALSSGESDVTDLISLDDDEIASVLAQETESRLPDPQQSNSNPPDERGQ